MNFDGIDYTTILSYIHEHCPWAFPYIQFLLWITPFLFVISGRIARHLPLPNQQIALFSDVEIEGKIPALWFKALDKVVKTTNQFVIVWNFILTTRPYAWFYAAICELGDHVRPTPRPENSLPPPPPMTREITPLQDQSVNPDNLSPEEIQKRTKLLTDELAKSSAKVIRSLAAQRAVQIDVDLAPPKAPTPDNVVPLVTPEKKSGTDDH